MKKLVRESILEPPSDEKILNKLSKLDPEEMLIISVQKGFWKGIKKAIERGANIDDALESPHTPISWGEPVDKYLDIVVYLVKQGATIQHDKDVAVNSAVEANRLDVVKYLIEQGGATFNKFGQPLLLAVRDGHLDIIKYFVNNGAKISKIVIEEAIENGYYDVAKYLRSKKDN